MTQMTTQEKILRSWLWLALLILAAAGALALVVLSAPANSEIIRHSTVLHANLASLLWPLAVIIFLATRQWSRLSITVFVLFCLAVGTLLVMVANNVGHPVLIRFMPRYSNLLYPALLAGIMLTALTLLVISGFARKEDETPVKSSLLWMALPISVTLIYPIWTWMTSSAPPSHIGEGLLFWSAGHAWQFALVSLTVWCWMQLSRVPVQQQHVWCALTSLPVLAMVIAQAFYPNEQDTYIQQLPQIMHWAIWPAPAAAGLWLLLSNQFRSTGGYALWSSIALFVGGFFLLHVIDDPVMSERHQLLLIQHTIGYALTFGLLGTLGRMFSRPQTPHRSPRFRISAGIAFALLVSTLLLSLTPQAIDFAIFRSLGFGSTTQTQEHVQSKQSEEIKKRFEEGVRMLQEQEYEQAMQAFHRVLELKPEMPEAHVNMGFALYEKGDYASAKLFFEGAIALNDGQLNAYYGLALTAAALENLPLAIEAMGIWLELAPPDATFRSKAEAKYEEFQKLHNNKSDKTPPSKQKPTGKKQ